MTYSDQLKDPRWQKKRLEILQRDAFQCSECGDDKSTLHVHHLYYVSKRMVWDYPEFALTTLCEECHGLRGEDWWTHNENGELKLEDFELMIRAVMRGSIDVAIDKEVNA